MSNLAGRAPVHKFLETMVTEEEYSSVRPVIERAQRAHIAAHSRLCALGVQPIDSLIAGTFAAHQLATAMHGNPVAAVEWMRDALDTIERQAIAAAA